MRASQRARGEDVALVDALLSADERRRSSGVRFDELRSEQKALGKLIPKASGDEKAELLKKNAKAAFYEPLVGSAAHALATVCDRVRYGTIPDAVAADATVQQAAALAANLASQVHRWAEFRATLRPHANGDVKALVLRALALGWSEKWRTP